MRVSTVTWKVTMAIIVLKILMSAGFVGLYLYIR